MFSKFTFRGEGGLLRKINGLHFFRHWTLDTVPNLNTYQWNFKFPLARITQGPVDNHEDAWCLLAGLQYSGSKQNLRHRGGWGHPLKYQPIHAAL